VEYALVPMSLEVLRRGFGKPPLSVVAHEGVACDFRSRMGMAPVDESLVTFSHDHWLS
jgi:hypothetical protein